ncbi:MAG: hypothetical protein HC896_05010, partial [Bacteroidales bacterium]|nr:hypothetical protein [Bacteroidales bacterium]
AESSATYDLEYIFIDMPSTELIIMVTDANNYKSAKQIINKRMSTFKLYKSIFISLSLALGFLAVSNAQPVITVETQIVGCYSGTITVRIANGASRYNFFLRDGGILGGPYASKIFTTDTFAVFSSLPSNTYGVIVYDGDAVTGSPYGTLRYAQDHTVSFSPLSAGDISVATDVSCNNSSDGQLMANPFWRCWPLYLYLVLR